MGRQEHGGNADKAAKKFGFAPQDMLDLSTGISPLPYPAPDIPADAWLRLPGDSELQACLQAARRFYHALPMQALMAGAGTQSLLQLIPTLSAPPGEVWMAMPGYNEHGPAWQRAGHQLSTASSLPQSAQSAVMIMPNNPTGDYDLAVMRSVADATLDRGGWLIIDGAFARPDDTKLITALSGHENILHLRSFGKFFGMAGLRLGFAIGAADVIERLTIAAGPWAVNTAALTIATQALADTEWQTRHLAFLDKQSDRLVRLLTDHGLIIRGRTNLFVTITLPQAAALHSHLARHRIWTRHFTAWPDLLRFGLPAKNAEFEQLAECLKNWRQKTNQ